MSFAAWIPQPGPDYRRILRQLIESHDRRGNLVPDTALAALAIEPSTRCVGRTRSAKTRRKLRPGKS